MNAEDYGTLKRLLSEGVRHSYDMRQLLMGRSDKPHTLRSLAYHADNIPRWVTYRVTKNDRYKTAKLLLCLMGPAGPYLSQALDLDHMMILWQAMNRIKLLADSDGQITDRSRRTFEARRCYRYIEDRLRLASHNQGNIWRDTNFSLPATFNLVRQIANAIRPHNRAPQHVGDAWRHLRDLLRLHCGLMAAKIEMRCLARIEDTFAFADVFQCDFIVGDTSSPAPRRK